MDSGLLYGARCIPSPSHRGCQAMRTVRRPPAAVPPGWPSGASTGSASLTMTCLHGGQGRMGWRLPLRAHDGDYLPEALHNDNNAYIYAKVIRGLRWRTGQDML